MNMKLQFKPKKVIKVLALLVLIGFGIVGSLMTSVVTHELSHKNDYQDVAQTDQTCFLSLPENRSLTSMTESELGFYTFTYDQKDAETVKEISAYTEYKAYSFSFIMMFLFIACALTLVLMEI